MYLWLLNFGTTTDHCSNWFIIIIIAPCPADLRGCSGLRGIFQPSLCNIIIYCRLSTWPTFRFVRIGVSFRCTLRCTLCFTIRCTVRCTLWCRLNCTLPYTALCTSVYPVYTSVYTAKCTIHCSVHFVVHCSVLCGVLCSVHCSVLCGVYFGVHYSRVVFVGGRGLSPQMLSQWLSSMVVPMVVPNDCRSLPQLPIVRPPTAFDLKYLPALQCTVVYCVVYTSVYCEVYFAVYTLVYIAVYCAMYTVFTCAKTLWCRLPLKCIQWTILA